MIILAFDASTLACSACVMQDGKILASRYLNTGLTHSQTLLPMIEGVLEDSGLSMDQIDRIGVTVGPGSFTGIKIAVATAKGLSHKNKTPCAPVSSLHALGEGISFEGTVCSVEDARRGMLYNANFKNGIRQCEDRQISVSDLLQETDGPVLFCGDGSQIAINEAQRLGRNAVCASADRAFIRAEIVAQIAWKMQEDALFSPEELEPRYLRLPQAERERNERENHLTERT
ncbi:MAG: tRNA (adenosine(37)-N6)-threonylcarbamoyltransferase complex dimerization subunit type 1 TsaB [Clostridia bacterium]|nr:tRNA (adenosine(37)-N6)-threonylcarbamoyltransferase complex dimerization subunit type 1 TsaB [Clostridia bacterium]